MSNGNCSSKLSGEHFITRAILNQLTKDGWSVEFAGLSWQEADSSRKIPINGLKSRILCENHNGGLSYLDGLANKFFHTVNQAHLILLDNKENITGDETSWNGNDFQRWLLKTLVGAAYSGNMATGAGIPIRNWKPSDNWIRILFGDEDFPAEWGLYCPGSLTPLVKREGHAAFGFSVLSNPGLGVYGLILDLGTLKFVLLMTNPPTNRADTILEGLIYRPDQLILKNGDTEKRFAFDWTGGPSGGVLTTFIKRPG